MNDLSPVPASNPAEAHRVLRFVALAAVILGVLVLAAAAFVLSYAGIHALALAAGVTPALARIYPLAFDAMGVVASAAVLSLRGAGVVTRCYAWLAMLLLLCAAAGADVLHAIGARLPHRAAEATVATVPWAFVLIGFGLLLAMLRHARLRRALATQARAIAPQGTAAHKGTPAQENGLQGETAAQENEPQQGTAAHSNGALGNGALGNGALGNGAPVEAARTSAGHSPARWVPRARDEDALGSEERYLRDYPAPVMSPAPTAHVTPGRHAGPETAAGADSAAGPENPAAAGPENPAAPETAASAERAHGPELAAPEPSADREPAALPEHEHGPLPVPHFDRMWSSPTPPDA
jgi:hypothetical protein